jgi:hypothetical protein
MATVSLLCLKPVNRGVPWCFSEKSNCVYTPPTEPFRARYRTVYTISADAKSVYSRLIPMETRLDTVSSRSIPTIADFATVTLLLMPVMSRWRPGNAPMLPVQVYENKTVWPRWHQSFGKNSAEMPSEGKGMKVRKNCAYKLKIHQLKIFFLLSFNKLSMLVFLL